MKPTVTKNLILCIVGSTLSAASLFGAERVDSVTALNEVVVTGTNREVADKLLPYSVSVVGERQLEAAGHTQVLSVLSGMVPSLFVTQRSYYGFGVSSSGGSGHIKLRGVGGDRASGVLMMVDGQPQFAGIYSHHVADFYGKEYVERVEVLRGPGSVLYGSNAMAGAINIITRNPRKDGVATTLSSQYGSYNTWLSTLSNSVRLGRFSSFLSGSYNRSDGTVRNFDFRQAEGYAKLSYAFSPQWSATADYTLMNLRANDPIYPKLANPASEDIYSQNVTRGEASLAAVNNYGATSGRIRLYYSYGNHFVDDPRHFHSTDDRLGLTLYQNFHPWSGAAASLGFDFDRYSGRIPVSGGNLHKPGSLSTLERKSITEYSPYLTISQSFAADLLNINAGLRVANSDMFRTRLIPQFGFALNPGNILTLKGNLAMGFRNPSFRELYLYRMANPDLEPERMMNYEFSVSRSFSRWLSVELTAYYSRGTNMIEVLDTKNRNTGRFINKGLELSARSHPLTALFLYATYSFLHTSLTDLTGAPRHQYYLGAEWMPLKVLTLSADIKGASDLYISGRTPRQNFALLNLKASWHILRNLSLFLRLENITDTRYCINEGYPMPGFTAMGGFKLSL